MILGRRAVLGGLAAVVAGPVMAGERNEGRRGMVYGLSQDNPDKFDYGWEALDGDIHKVAPLDSSRDDGWRASGGVGWLTFGRPVHPDNMPTRIRRKGPHRFMPDVVWPFLVPMVNDAVKEIIERFEPGVHQFFPVDIVWKNGDLAGKRHILVVCHRLDTIHRELSTMEFSGVLWRGRADWRGRKISQMVFDKTKIGDRHLWRDKHLLTPVVFSSEAVAQALLNASVTGIKFEHRDEA